MQQGRIYIMQQGRIYIMQQGRIYIMQQGRIYIMQQGRMHKCAYIKTIECNNVLSSSIGFAHTGLLTLHFFKNALKIQCFLLYIVSCQNNKVVSI